MSRFDDFMPFIFDWECVKDRKGNVISENDPDDPGGLTKYGIDQRSHPHVDIRNLTESGAKDIYLREYWQKYGVEDKPRWFGEVYFNCCVNAGSGRAVKIAAVSGADADKFLDGQEDFYRRLAASKLSLGKFLKGWLNRTTALRKFIHAH